MKFSNSFLILSCLFLALVFSCKSKQPVVIDDQSAPPNADVIDSEETISPEEQKNIEKQALLNKLNMLDGVSAKIIADQNTSFHSMYELKIEQPVNHKDSRSEKFTQKVYLSHKDFSKPMVMYLNGYTAGSNSYVTEAAQILESNQIHVEHRFFSQSRPEDIPWDLLTIEQAANDHHRIVTVLKNIYSQPWVSTGISKGGQVTIFHKRFFPEDVAVAIPYVAPINLERHDQRIYDHLSSVGSEECRKKVLDFQKSLLLDREEALNLFSKYSNKAGYKYPHGLEASFELSVFEFSFAFWQWSGDCNTIPDIDSSTEERMQYLFYQIDAPSFFNETTLTDILPFFYQGYYEIGMYGYEVTDFTGLTKVYTEEVDNYHTFIPEGIEVQYTSESVKDVTRWLDRNGNNMIYIYGAYDPWGATAYEPTEYTNSLFLNLDAGNHGTRLKNFPRNTQAMAMDSLQVWVDRAN